MKMTFWRGQQRIICIFFVLIHSNVFLPEINNEISRIIFKENKIIMDVFFPDGLLFTPNNI